MIIGDQYRHLKHSLQKIYPKDEAFAMAALLMEYYTGFRQNELSIHRHESIPDVTATNIAHALGQVLNYKPLQYVLQEAWFYGLKIYVDENVLIPRPETEELVHEALQWLRVSKIRNEESVQVLDIGTGSGCIAISLKNQIPALQVTAIDTSEDALMVAQRNALGLQTPVAFRQVDFLDERCWDDLPVFDLIISNPPYIPGVEADRLYKNVRDWEPALALFVPDDDALLFYRKILAFANDHLAENGAAFMECHYERAIQARQLFEKANYKATLKKDMHGNDRILIAGK